VASSSSQPVIIIKKKAAHKHGHHGGAWKVAYADFVTAMMAFFLVMWLVGQGPQVREAVASYFRDPGAFDEGGRGVLPGVEAGATGGGLRGAVAEPPPTDVQTAKATLEAAAEHLRSTIELKFASIKDRIQITLTPEGLRIELSEKPNEGFFASGSAQMAPETSQVLAVIADELGKLPNKVAVEGHTDSTPYGSQSYTNWELSADRANAARRVLERTGLKTGQILEVRGYAYSVPRFPDRPQDAGNRRISIVVRRDDLMPAAAPAS
jgi:chemotaxis protein MotB